MKYIDLEEILRIHFQIITDFGGSHGVRDETRLKFVVVAPKQSVFGQDQYPTIYEKAAVYIRNIVGDHPFADGNKRTAITVGGIFLMRNGHRMTAKPKELEDFAVKIVVDKLNVQEIANWLQTNSKN